MLKNELIKRILAGDYESPDKYRAFINALYDCLEEQILADEKPNIASTRILAIEIVMSINYLGCFDNFNTRQEQQAFVCRCYAVWKDREKSLPHLMEFFEPKQ